MLLCARRSVAKSAAELVDLKVRQTTNNNTLCTVYTVIVGARTRPHVRQLWLVTGLGRFDIIAYRVPRTMEKHTCLVISAVIAENTTTLYDYYEVQQKT